MPVGSIMAYDGSIAVGANFGSIALHQAPRARLAWPRQVGVLPPQADCFQERGQVEELDAVSAGTSTAVVCQVLSGAGGVGKTQLAAHYARRRWAAGTLDLLVWVTAGSREALLSSYAEAAQAVLGADEANPERAAQQFLEWLAMTDRPWLVVLDDVAEPADLTGLWPPSHPAGRTVVTTRRRDAALSGAGRIRVEVGIFTISEACAYISAKLDTVGKADDSEQIAGLARDLGCLPLGLAQAVAYLLDTELDCDSYRARWADRRRTLARLVPQAGGLPDDQRLGLGASWSLSVERADALDPAGLARPMMQLAAMLDSNGIPMTVLTSTPALAYLAEHKTSVPDGGSPGGARPRRRRWRTRPQPEQSPPVEAVEAEDASDALACLARLSLVALSGSGAQQREVRVHGLVQRAVRETLNEGGLADAARAAAASLMAVWPESVHDSGLAQVFRGNVAALAESDLDVLWEPSGHTALLRAGTSLGEWGLASEAVAYWTRLVAMNEARLGADHVATLFARYHLVSQRGEAGDPRGAALASEKLLEDRLRVLGPDHLDTLNTRSQVAFWRGASGDVAGAIVALEALLDDQRRILGADHVEVLRTRGTLLGLHGEASDEAGAAEAIEALLDDELRILGPDHPSTLITRNNLAYKRGETGDTAGAIAAFEALLEDQARVLGPDHRDALTTRGNLALQRGQAGDVAGAISAYEALLEDELRVLGPDHPSTLVTRDSLASFRGEAGDDAGAIAAFEALLEDRLRVLGPDHPHTLKTRAKLAHRRGQSGDAAGAAAAYEVLLEDRLRVLGPDHPNTRNTRGLLAHWRGVAGDLAGAVSAYEELIFEQLRVLGPDDPETLAYRSALARWRGEAGDAAGAVRDFEALVADHLRVVGP
ncbi:MAG TPA: tetratricopeptide repeat protein, partial [Trebonia sp.]|nr:tetratricopeptide repeat protein [Trebonia sp.]